MLRRLTGRAFVRLCFRSRTTLIKSCSIPQVARRRLERKPQIRYVRITRAPPVVLSQIQTHVASLAVRSSVHKVFWRRKHDSAELVYI